MVYEWAENRYGTLDPQRTGEALERLAARRGGAASGPQVVAEARNNNSQIWQDIGARIFRLDEKDAAEQHYNVEADRLVRAVVVVQKRPEGDIRRPAFFHVAYNANGEESRVEGYMPTEKVIETPSAKSSAENYLRAQLEGLERRFRHIVDPDIYGAVWEAIEELPQEDEAE